MELALHHKSLGAGCVWQLGHEGREEKGMWPPYRIKNTKLSPASVLKDVTKASRLLQLWNSLGKITFLCVVFESCVLIWKQNHYSNICVKAAWSNENKTSDPLESGIYCDFPTKQLSKNCLFSMLLSLPPAVDILRQVIVGGCRWVKHWSTLVCHVIPALSFWWWLIHFPP